MKTILIVDDELANAEVLASILSDEGYRVVCAANGRQGLDLLDVMMPVMNGVQMGEALRKDPAYMHIKLLMSTSLRESTLREQFTAYDAFLRKPFSADAVLRTIQQLIGPPEAIPGVFLSCQACGQAGDSLCIS